MPGARMQRRLDEIAALPDPREDQVWFQELSPERRSEMTEAWRQDLVRDVHLNARGLRVGLVDVAIAVSIFVFFELGSNGFSALTLVWAVAFGALLGTLIVLADGGRFLCALFAMSLFAYHLWLTRGGIGAQHLFLFCPVGFSFAIFGWRREERPYDS